MTNFHKQQRQARHSAAQRTPYTRPQVDAVIRKVDVMIREVAATIAEARALHLQNLRESEETRKVIAKAEALQATANRIEKALRPANNGKGEVNADVADVMKALVK
jgi:hypothetical protein